MSDAPLSAPEIAAGFARATAWRRMDRQRDRYRDPDFWRTLCPDLTITDRPFRRESPGVAIAPDAVDALGRRLRDEGYCDSPPIVPEEMRATLARGILGLAAHEIPVTFAALFDEYYQAFEGLEPLFAPLLGDGYRWIARGVSAFHVPPGDLALSGLTAIFPHRDILGPDPAVLAHRVPSIVTVWMALTDVSPAESCLYVVPADLDPDYFTTERDVHRGRIRLQAIRALPVRAGSVLAWSKHLIHWGSVASVRARHARMSITIDFQRRDVPPFDDTVFDHGDAVPFRDRLRWVAYSLGRPGYFDEHGPT